MEYWFPAYYVAAMFIAAMVPKALGATIAFALGLLCVYPSVEQAGLLVVMYVPSVLIAAFRD